jgi:hypothetical protein
MTTKEKENVSEFISAIAGIFLAFAIGLLCCL